MKRLLASMLLLVLISTFAYAEYFKVLSAKATVLEVVSGFTEEEISENDEVPEEYYQNETSDRIDQMVKVKVTSGKYKGQILLIQNSVSSQFLGAIEAKVDDKLIIDIIEEEGFFQSAHVSDYQRDWFIYILLAIFILVLVEIGHYSGVKALGSLVLTFLLIAKVLLPLILKGYDPILLAGLISVVVTFATLLIINGSNHKTWAAIIGTVTGVVVAAGLAILGSKLINLTGLSMDEASILWILTDGNLDFAGLLTAGIIIGSLGAVMDVAMSIASAMTEIADVNPELTFKELYSSGINVGRDISGTMSNTLILAYVGSSLPLLLLFQASGEQFLKIMNMDMIVGELVRAFAGSIGLMLTIPVTALIMAFFRTKLVKNQDEYYF